MGWTNFFITETGTNYTFVKLGMKTVSLDVYFYFQVMSNNNMEV